MSATESQSERLPDGGGGQPDPKSPTTATYPKAARRRWLPLVGAFLLGSIVAAVTSLIVTGVWCNPWQESTATAGLRIATREPRLVFGPAGQSVENEFEIYKRRQRSLVKSEFVLGNALKPYRDEGGNEIKPAQLKRYFSDQRISDG